MPHVSRKKKNYIAPRKMPPSVPYKTHHLAPKNASFRQVQDASFDHRENASFGHMNNASVVREKPPPSVPPYCLHWLPKKRPRWLIGCHHRLSLFVRTRHSCSKPHGPTSHVEIAFIPRHRRTCPRIRQETAAAHHLHAHPGSTFLKATT